MPSLRYYPVALKLSKFSRHPKHKMAAVVVRGGAILKTAVNLPVFEAHAEIRAIKNIRAKGATVYIARLGHKMSKPCSKCMELLKKSEISYIVYVDWSGQIIVERLNTNATTVLQ